MLKTEMRKPHSMHIDRMDSAEILRVIQAENKQAVDAIDAELDAISAAVDAITERMKKGGRLFYVGCGTSGRLGVLDASECPPTYGVPGDRVMGIIAGGDRALRYAVEGAEDDETAGRADLAVYEITPEDSVVGISVAGGAAYVLGALRQGKACGALTIALTCNSPCPLEAVADIRIHPDTGAEVITGSTRMKAGSAHKMILNMLSTAVMVRLGYVYENLMINLKPSNDKLRRRMCRIVCDITGCGEGAAETLLEAADWDIRTAVEYGESGIHQREKKV